MRRGNGAGDDADHLALLVPDLYVDQPPQPPDPPPMPGTVLSIEQLRPPANPPTPFLFPRHSAATATASTSSDVSCPVTGRNRLRPVHCRIDAAKLDAFNERHGVREVVEAVFKDRVTGDDAEQREQFIDNVMQSLRDPFRANAASTIVWTYAAVVRPNFGLPDSKLGGKKLKTRHRELKGLPWSIESFGDAHGGGGVRRNLVYDDRGEAVAQIDFGHGATIGIHIHALVQGNLEHTAGSAADHCFPLASIPWVWLAVPDVWWRVHRQPGWLRCYDANAVVSNRQNNAVVNSIAAATLASRMAVSAEHHHDEEADWFGSGMAFVAATADDASVLKHWHSVWIPFEDFSGGGSSNSM